MYENDETLEMTPLAKFWSITSIVLALAVIAFCMWGCPSYNVWRAEMQGRAELKRAEQNRTIKIEEAKANLEAEKLNAQAEIERAKGAKLAMEEEGGALTEMYIRYLWVRQLNLSQSETIYIPSAGGIPILESTRNFDYGEIAKHLNGSN